MARSGFDIRFGFVRWLAHLRDGEAVGYAEIGRAVGELAGTEALTGQTVSGWTRRDEATDSYRNNRALASYFGVAEAWLVDGQGEPPRPDLWLIWTKERAKRGAKQSRGVPARKSADEGRKRA